MTAIAPSEPSVSGTGIPDALTPLFHELLSPSPGSLQETIEFQEPATGNDREKQACDSRSNENQKILDHVTMVWQA